MSPCPSLIFLDVYVRFLKDAREKRLSFNHEYFRKHKCYDCRQVKFLSVLTKDGLNPSC